MPGDPILNSDGEEVVGEVAVTVPVSDKDGDFEIIEKICRVIDGRSCHRVDVNSWNIDTERDTRDTEVVLERRTRINRLVEKFEDQVYKAESKQQKKSKVSKNDFPRTVAEAMAIPDWDKWKKAIKKEMESIVRMGHFVI